MRAVQGLHLALLIAGQNNGVFRRVQIQTDHILQLLDKLFVVGKFEGACQMRLQAMSPPDSPYRGLADAGCPGHQGPAPVRGVRRLPFDRLLHDPGPLPAADRGNPSTAGSVLFDSPEAIFNETIAPTSGLLTSDVQLGGDLLIVQTPGGQQDNSRSFRQPDRHTAASAQSLQFLPHRNVQFNRRCSPHIYSDVGKLNKLH